VRAFLDDLSVQPADEICVSSGGCGLAGDVSGALKLLGRASNPTPTTSGAVGRRRIHHGSTQRSREASRLIGRVPDDADPRCAALKARLQFMGAAGETKRR